MTEETEENNIQCHEKAGIQETTKANTSARGKNIIFSM